ncbi:MAG: hypothetical protein LUO80_06565, partial [Methylococcaceae bacterium]|nr:hypothetical protein [Methylococcaceae bacterium]
GANGGLGHSGIEDYPDRSVMTRNEVTLPGKVALLQTIGRDYPNSVNALAALTGRTSFNVYRTLKRLNKTCSIRLAPGRGRIRQPVLVARKVRLE